MPDVSLQSDIVWIDGGVSHIGTDHPKFKVDGEAPRRTVRLSPYGMAKTVVTNLQFAAFVRETRYRSDAHTYGWSFVFRGLLPTNVGQQAPGLPWWNAVDGAAWDTPLGIGSSWRDAPDHPVVHVSWNDARAYARWAGGRLPTEAEWEHAARGGANSACYPWGDEEPTDTNILCNIWQGEFPVQNTCEDGYYGTAPAISFRPNPFGLFNMSGNVWEWCTDPFKIRSLSAGAKARNLAARREKEKLMKGGSFLCHASYCWRYRIAARTGRQHDNSAIHTGFRIAFDPK